MLKQDETAITVLRRKKIMPGVENYQSIRSSRQTYRSNAGLYWLIKDLVEEKRNFFFLLSHHFMWYY